MRDTKWKTVAGAAAALLVVGAMSGCSNPIDDLIQQGTEKAIEDVATEHLGEDVDLNVGNGASLPDGWPSEIPVPNGEIAMSAKAEGGFTVTYLTDEAEAAKALQAIALAGFTEDASMDMGEMKVNSYKNSDWQVQVTVIPDSQDGKTAVAYVVSPATP